MKKAKDARPNQALFQAREQMGWSRAHLADQVGTNAFTIYRWERGLAFPGYFFRHKLCEVFHSTPEALGLIHAEANQRADTSPLIPPPDAPPPVEGLPQPPTVIGREVCLSQLQRDLDMAAAVALSGLPGVGKTTLVARLAQDAESQARYPDGVLWARLGPQADAQAQLGQWAMQLGMSERHLASVRDGATLSRMVHLLLHTKQMVLVIDDAWQIEEALLFKVGGPRCSHLLTTRFPSLAQQFAPGHTFAIPELDAQASWTLLEVSAPTAVVYAPDLIRELLPSVGGLPLALLLLGRALERYAQTGQARRVRTFLRDMHETAPRLSLTAPVAPTDVIPSGVTYSTISLEAVIGQSVQRLEPAARCWPTSRSFPPSLTALPRPWHIV